MTEQDEKIKKITPILFFTWVFGLLFIVGGAVALTYSKNVSGIILFVLGILILPLVDNLFKKKLHFEFSTSVKIIVIVIGFLVIGTTAYLDTTMPSINLAGVQQQDSVKTTESAKQVQPASAAEPAAKIESTLKITQLTCRDDDGDAEALGLIENIGTTTEEFVKVSIEYYDGDTLVDTDSTYVSSTDIPPGATSSFKTKNYDSPTWTDCKAKVISN